MNMLREYHQSAIRENTLVAEIASKVGVLLRLPTRNDLLCELDIILFPLLLSW